MLRSVASSSGSLMSSNHGCYNACSPVSLSAGSILSKPNIKLSAFLDKLLIYLFSNVSGFETSGNLRPLNLGFDVKLCY